MEKAAETLERHKGEVMRRWAESVKKKIKGADHSNEMVLLDHLPDLLDDMLQLLKSSPNLEELLETEKSNGLFKMSVEHGRHRSASYGYSIDQIIYEYIVFHRIVTDLLIENKAFTQEVSQLVAYSIEASMMYSSAAFSSSLNEMRQKLLSILAHDLRNPITTALLGVSVMESGDRNGNFEKVKGLAKSSLKRALDLIEGLLDTVSIEAGEGMTITFSEVDLMEYVKSLHFEASEVYTNEIELQVEGEEDITGIFDGAMIRRVLENFVSNAIKYGERNTPVKIKVKNEDEYVSISVHNHGKPIPEDKKEEIFRFLKTAGNGKTGVKSWGIGLALVKAVVEAHHGRLYVESSRKEGTVFEIVLNKFRNEPGKKKAALSFR